MSEKMFQEDVTHRQKFERQRLLGAILSLSGIVTFVLSVILLLSLTTIINALSTEPELSNSLRGLILFVRMFVLVPLILFGAHLIPRWSLRIRRLGKRFYTATDAQTVVSQDLRPLVLYLRSFREAADNELRSDMRTSEELLADVLKDVGPFVAIGNPTDQAVILGASRFYLKTNIDWQDFIDKLMHKSGLIVIDPQSQGEGLRWEITRVLKDASLREKVIFHFLPYQYLSHKSYKGLFRPDAEHHGQDARLEAASLLSSLLGVPPPAFTSKAMFLSFGGDGQPRFTEPNGWVEEVFGRESTVVIRETLRPLLKQKGFRLRWWTTPIRFLATSTFVTLLLAAGLLLKLFNIGILFDVVFPLAVFVFIYKFYKFILRKLTFK